MLLDQARSLLVDDVLLLLVITLLPDYIMLLLLLIYHIAFPIITVGLIHMLHVLQ